MAEHASEEPEEHRRPSRQTGAEGERNSNEQPASDEFERAGDSGDDPDVYLDVPVVKVDEITLDVEDLRARVSLQAEVLDLLKLNVGVDAALGHVGLDIKGVEAQALLKVRLGNVAGILDRVLTTIDRNPQILEHITKGVESATRSVGEGAGEAVQQVGQGTGKAVEEVGEGAGEAVEQVGQGAGGAVEDVGQGAGQAVEDVGQSAEELGANGAEAVRDTGRSAGKAVGGGGQDSDSSTEEANAQGSAEGKESERTREHERRVPRRDSGRRPRPRRRDERR